jgi:hypothetical protein
MSDPGSTDGSWTLLTGHGHVLVEIARNPEARIRDISAVVGLTDRTVQAIVADLEAAGYLTRTRIGRRTRYTVNHDSLFRHSAQEGLRIGPLLDLLGAPDGDGCPAETELPAARPGQPAAASVTWRSSSAVVTGPTPPGTGLSAPATSATFGSTSPARPPSGVAFVPTSMTVVPGAT